MQLILNCWLLAALVVTIAAITLNIYTMEVWIWPKLRDEGFPSCPFDPPRVVKGFHRAVRHFFTVNLLITIGC